MEMRDVCSRAMVALSDQGAETGEIASPPLFAELTEAQKIVMSYEAARGWGDFCVSHRSDISDQFAQLVEDGLRVTDARTMEVVEMVLAGSINKEIVALINAEGEWAIGLCGKDGNMVFAKKAVKTVKDPSSNIEKVLDLGFVGEPVEVDRTLLDLLARSEMIPVIAPVAPGRDGNTYNINADTFAGAIAGSLGAKRLLFLTDVDQAGLLGTVEEVRDVGVLVGSQPGDDRRDRAFPGPGGSPQVAMKELPGAGEFSLFFATRFRSSVATAIFPVRIGNTPRRPDTPKLC